MENRRLERSLIRVFDALDPKTHGASARPTDQRRSDVVA